jgi:hypothetical protein
MSPFAITGMDDGFERPARLPTSRRRLAKNWLASAAVNGEHADRRRLGAFGDVRRVERFESIPAEPHLERHRQLGCVHRCFDQRHRVIGFSHERRAAEATGHALGWAAHIDVDDVGASCLCNACALGHPRWITTASWITSGEITPLPAARRTMSIRARANWSEATISETQYWPPKALTCRRNGMSVTPAIGASETRGGFSFKSNTEHPNPGVSLGRLKSGRQGFYAAMQHLGAGFLQS